MKPLGVNEIREKYLSFFEEKGHLRMESASLVPVNDKSLLLINSGMAPLKPYFTGQETPPRKRVATCQKCIRTGDIENVGKTARHGTFFEMLGNFSFGDYFKKEIIPWSWEFVTQTLEIPEDRLFVSIYEDDDEAFQIWHEDVGIPKDKIFRMGKEDNFWEVGIGPCGPCSEIYYDRGEKYGCGEEGCTVGCDCDRYMEFWNLVFTQFDKGEDGSYTPLAHPNIDTGMGLERMAVIMQDVYSIFDVDTIKAIRDEVCKVMKVAYGKSPKVDESVRVITDHIRSVTFMTADGVLPSNEGRGYVLRRLLRRAVRHGKLLGRQEPFLTKICQVVIDNSKDAYPQLVEKKEYIFKVLSIEEERFNETINKGFELLNSAIEGLKSRMQDIKDAVMDGKTLFKLYDTYGFPVELTREILEEQGIGFYEEEFQQEMENQRRRAQQAREENTYMGADDTVYNQLDPALTTRYLGHDALQTKDAKITAIIAGDKISDKASAGEDICIITDVTPFYAESGGQVGDKGILQTSAGLAEIYTCLKIGGNKHAHIGKLEQGSIEVGESCLLQVDEENRMSISRNHSATHLLQKALRNQLGSHVEQSGSLVSPGKLRFDFTHFAPVTEKEIKAVEFEVNNAVLSALPVQAEEMSMQDAREKGAMALFGEKYGDTVRVVDMGGWSVELCGGAHVDNTAKIGTFKIISETGVAAGVRRIEAVTGFNTLEFINNQQEIIRSVGAMLKARPSEMLLKMKQLMEAKKEFAKQIDQLKGQMAKNIVSDLLAQKEAIGGVDTLVTSVDGIDMNKLREMGDQLKDKIQSGVVVLASKEGDKVNLIVTATEDVVKKGVHAGNIIKEIAKVCGGGGGGRPNMAQAGGKDTSKIADCLVKAKEMIQSQLG